VAVIFVNKVGVWAKTINPIKLVAKVIEKIEGQKDADVFVMLDTFSFVFFFTILEILV